MALTIGYYDPFDIYPQVCNDLYKYLPLTNLNWKSNSTIKSIPPLTPRFIEEVPRANGVLPSLPISAETAKDNNYNVYCRIIFVKYNNLDVYRSQVRPLIREWLKHIVEKSGSEWMIVLYTPEGTKEKSTIMKMSPFDKLKNDFGKGSSEEMSRCIRLKNSSESYTELTYNIKQLLLASFSTKYAEYRVSGSLLDEFIRKLSLAQLFSDMHLYTDALNVYAELESHIGSIGEVFDGECTLANIVENGNINAAVAKRYIFTNESRLLQELADSPKAPFSIAALHLSALYQKLSGFLHSLSDGEKSSRFKVAMVDEYLNIPVFHRIARVGGSAMNEIMEFRGELVLLKRSAFVEMGKAKGYRVPFMYEEVNLDDQQEKTEISEKTGNGLDSFSDFVETYKSITHQAIENFVPCNRTKTVDILSIDLAILNYHTGDYSSALGVLKDSCDFFIQSGWEYLGGVLLDIYLDCLERLQPEDHESIMLTCLKLLANGHKGQLQPVFDMMVEQSLLSEPTAFALDDVFTATIAPYIHGEGYRCYVELTLQSPVEVHFKEIVVESESMRFLQKDVTVVRNSTVRLYSADFVAGTHIFSQIELKVNDNISFVRELADPNCTVIMNGETPEGPSQSATLFQNVDGLWVEFFSAIVELGKSAMGLRVNNGAEDISDVHVHISSPDEGMVLEKCDFTIDSLSAQENVSLEIPYEYSNKMITAEATISYKLKGIAHSHRVTQALDTSLKIAVSVQDVFRSHFLFSKFQIGPANPKSPIRILHNMLSSDERYTIEHSPHDVGELVAFAEQPVSVFYKVIPKDSVLASDSLALEIKYSVIEEECIEHCKKYLLSELRKRGLHKYWFVVKPIVESIEFDLSRFVFEKQLVVMNKSSVDSLVQASLQDIKKEDCKAVCGLLEFQEVPCGDVPQVPRFLRISVPMPVLDYLHLVEFCFEKRAQYVVGDAFETELMIETVMKYGSKTEGTFEVEIQNDDNWLISGLKRHTFSEKKVSLKLSMVPLNVGQLQLPKLVISGNSEVVIKNGMETVLVVPEIDKMTFSF